MKPLEGIRILSMEQAAALPFATRHLADLGAEVIRVQSHKRPLGVLQEIHYYRNKKMIGLDLSHPEGPEVFRQLSDGVDIVAHNFTPRVMRKYGLDFDSLSSRNKNLIYCAVTGFGTTGPWADRPLFGPGAEAMSGQNSMIGEPGALTPGRPGTITYADNVCGLYLLFAVLGALEKRQKSSGSQHVEVSLYETGVAHIGCVLAERAAGAEIPEPIGTSEIAVSDVAEVLRDTRKWRRGCFVPTPQGLTSAPVWGGGADVWVADSVGQHNRATLQDIAQMSPDQINKLCENDVVGEVPLDFSISPKSDIQKAIERGMLDRIDPDFENWKQLQQEPLTPTWSFTGTYKAPFNRCVVEVSGSVAVAQASRQFAALGWKVIRVGSPVKRDYRWGQGKGAANAYLDYGKIETDKTLTELVEQADIVIGDERVAAVQGPGVVLVISGWGMGDPRSWDDLELQATSGFMSVTGEYDQPPQQLPPYAAEMTGGLAAAATAMAAYMECNRVGHSIRIDFALADVLTTFVQSETGRYASTGEVAGRESRVKYALRMVPTADGFLYCAPGAVMNVAMDGVAKLTGEDRLADERFSTAEGRMDNWDEYVGLMVGAFASHSAAFWFAEAEKLHLTFALVQFVDDLLSCPQLHDRGLLIDSKGTRFPLSGFRIEKN